MDQKEYGYTTGQKGCGYIMDQQGYGYIMGQKGYEAKKDVGKLWVKSMWVHYGTERMWYTKEVCRDAMGQKGTPWHKRRR